MACSLAELISEARIAHRSPPASLPAKRAFFLPRGTGLDRSLHGVVIDLDPSVVEEHGQPFPVTKRVADRFSQGRLCRDLREPVSSHRFSATISGFVSA